MNDDSTYPKATSSMKLGIDSFLVAISLAMS